MSRAASAPFRLSPSLLRSASRPTFHASLLSPPFASQPTAHASLLLSLPFHVHPSSHSPRPPPRHSRHTGSQRRSSRAPASGTDWSYAATELQFCKLVIVKQKFHLTPFKCLVILKCQTIGHDAPHRKSIFFPEVWCTAMQMVHFDTISSGYEYISHVN